MRQQFQVGDKAVYPVHGVAEVVSLEKRDIGGNASSFGDPQREPVGVRVPVAQHDLLGVGVVRVEESTNPPIASSDTCGWRLRAR